MLGEDWQAVLVLLGANWPHYMNRHPAELLDALSALPAAVLAENPRLKVAREYVARTLSAQGRPLVFREAVSSDMLRTPLDRCAELTAQSVALRAAGRFTDAVAMVDTAKEVLAGLRHQELQDVARALPELRYQWGLTRELAGQYHAALTEYTSSFDYATATEHTRMQAMSAASASWIHVLAGRTRAARQWLDRIPPSTPDDWWRHRTPAPAQFTRAILAIDALQPETAEHLIDQVDIRQSAEHWAPYQFVRGVVAVYRGGARTQLAELEAFIAEIPEQQAATGGNAALLGLTRHTLFTVLGQSANAHNALHDDRLTPAGSLLTQLAAVIEARWLAHNHQFAAARKFVVPLIGAATAYPRVLVPALFIAGMAYRADGDTTTGNEYIIDALNLAPAYGLFGSITTNMRNVIDDMIAEGALDPAAADPIRHAPASGVTGSPFVALTPREHETVTHAAAGATVTQIADAMFISPNTVKTLLKNVYRKLGVHTRTELTTLAHAHGYPPFTRPVPKNETGTTREPLQNRLRPSRHQ
ncbi:helix-turn-helix transcriptional regulator [Herbiconiux ginsengi]|uniref:helix-turn-helix transcriptional regulator n=1 Tax=Herbiconiux ginsengi TaxID=381665 RepID=UPI000B804599|nr:helix-turn-helix domain-containing protein [Herbiconiux ginsengi]